MENETIKVCLEVSKSGGEFARLCFEATANTINEVWSVYGPLFMAQLSTVY